MFSGHRGGEDGESSPQPSGLGFALTIGVEMVASVVVGIGIGYLIDLAIGTTPWGMVVFFFFGAAAGIRNAYRKALSLPNGRGSSREGPDAEDKNED